LRSDTYDHVWEGAFLTITEAQVFKGKYKIEEFTPGHNWDGPYQGVDFGFAQDPTAASRVWIYDKRLWVEYEAGKVGLELDDTSDFICDRIPDFANYTSRADSARPESISYLKRHGLPKMVGVKKWPGSVADGLAHMKSYEEIIIHPRCTSTAREFRLYSYKVDRNSGDIMPVIVDANNHYIDEIRYALAPMMQAKSGPSIRTL
jgi:phage terminase large subunit